jgi:hypothetical protein
MFVNSSNRSNRFLHSAALALIATGIVTVQTACNSTESDSGKSTNTDIVQGDSASGPALCTAIRGNGHYIVTHFASMARIVETYGLIGGAAGGSSGSISVFVYDSILKNPAATTCSKGACNDVDASARVALLLKSVQGYGEALAASDEAVAISDLVTIVGKLKKNVETAGVAALLDSDTKKAAEKLVELLQTPELKAIINPEILDLLTDPTKLSFGPRDVHASIMTFGAFSVSDNRLFFRPGVLAWSGLADLFARVGNFYAGYAPADGTALSGWLDACADRAVGKPWSEVRDIPAAGSTCGQAFAGLVSSYRDKARQNPGGQSRINERVSEGRPGFKKLLATSVLENDAIAQYNDARTKYLAGDFPMGDIAFSPSFSDVKFGYWGSNSDLLKVAENSRKYEDAKTAKFTSLGDATWKEVLSASPAEPGLSRFVTLPDGRISGGGWSDLAPVLALKNLGCQSVVYITRQGDESKFATAIAKRLGMDQAGWESLYPLSGSSAYSKSLTEANGVWCTDWNSFGDLEQAKMALDAYAAPLEVRGKMPKALRDYGTAASVGKPGCSPEVKGSATFP